jgi:hypothetical protein
MPQDVEGGRRYRSIPLDLRTGCEVVSITPQLFVGPIADMNTVQKRKTFCPCWESNTDSSAVQPIA